MFRNRSRSKAWKQLGPSGNKVAQWLFERTNWSGLVAERCNIVKGYGSRARPLWGWGQEEEAAASQILSADIQCDITHSRYGLSSGMHARVRAGRETEREWIFAHDSIYKATFDLIFENFTSKNYLPLWSNSIYRNYEMKEVKFDGSYGMRKLYSIG